MRAAGIFGRALVLSFGLMGFGAGLEPASAESAAGHEVPSCVPRALCCKMCKKGVACGDSCVSGRYSCQKERGCACDADEICE